MRPHVLRLVLLVTLGVALSLGAAACQSSTSAKAKEASRQQEARKRLLQKRREAIAKREQRQQELDNAKAENDLKPDPSMTGREYWRIHWRRASPRHGTN